MDDSQTQADRFHTIVAALIALVTVVGAVISWRIAMTLDAAGGADSAGLQAAVEKAEVTTWATIILMEHLTTYSSFTENAALARAYDALARADPQQTDLSLSAKVFTVAAIRALSAIPQRYVDRDEGLNRQRDLGENVAQGSQNRDVEPQPHFARADASRQKARWLFVTILSFSLAALLLTIADAMRNPLRYLFLLGGVGIFALAVMLGMFVEISSALGLSWR